MTTTAPQMTGQTGHMYGLDLLRFALAFAVMVYHFGYYGPETVGSTPIETSMGPKAFVGLHAVSIFFVVSGFVITLSLSKRDWKDFLWARTRRLMPALIICATITSAIVVAFEPDVPGGLGTLWLKSVSFLPMIFGGESLDDSYWSIAFEMRFYVIVALMMIAGMTRHLDVLLLVLSLAGSVLAIGFGLVGFASAILFPYAPLFALGVLLATRQRDGPTSRWAIMFLLHATLALAMLYLFGQLGRGTAGLTKSALVLISAVGLILMASKVKVPSKWYGATAVLGAVSYPLYLIHQRTGYVLVNSLFESGMAVDWILPTAMVTMAALAYVVAVYLEKPLSGFLNRGHQFIKTPANAGSSGEVGFRPIIDQDLCQQSR